MKIAVNTRLLLKDRLEGIGWFSYETLKRITNTHKEHEFIFIFDRPYDEEFIFSSNVTPLVVSPPTRHPFLWYLWLEHSIPKALKKNNSDLFFSPDGFLSLSTDVKSHAVIHDINFLHRPQDLPLMVRKYYNYYFPKFANKASRLATVSEYSKNDICSSYNVDANKIDVVYNGANENYSIISDSEKELTKIKYSNSCDYFVFIGSLHPRKNVANLLRSFNKFKQIQSSDIKLLIVGEAMFKSKEIQDVYSSMEFKNDVVFTGRLNPDELKAVLGSALALTFVPFFEGFGIPVLEAMYSGVPVLASDVTSVPEVGGDAALYVDPFSIDSICDGMLKIAFDDQLRSSLIDNSIIQKEKFSWDKTADKLWNSIDKCL